ncbi:MAG: diguanylate cyclase [Leptothrix ochracea]|uniref:diguanylate cyclase domain-containing protein n=3 Tax=Leptothrix ochracea TaxID=735331 RepID=UPI0034E2C8DC
MAISMASATLARPVQMDVLAYRHDSEMPDRFDSLIRQLNQAFPEHHFQLRFCTYPELEDDLRQDKADFILTNPGHYFVVSERFALSAPLATWVHPGPEPLSVFGGVIVVRADRHDLQTIRDLKEHRVAAVTRSSFGGFMAQAFEAEQVGLSYDHDFTVEFVGTPHDAVIREVMAGRADAGFVRTGVVESMIRDGQLQATDLRILPAPTIEPQPPSGTPLRNTRSQRFPLHVSTRLYPEWPLVARNRIEEDLARRMTAVVLGLATPASSGQMPYFTVPSRYDETENVLRTLRLPPFDHMPAFTVVDIWSRYPWQIAVTSGLVLTVMLLSIWLIHTNQTLTLKRARIQKEIEQRQNLLETMNEGVYELDSTGRCAVINTAALQMLGYERSELIGQDIHQRIHHHHEDGTEYSPQACPVLKTRFDGLSRNVEDWFFRRTGQGFPVALRVSAHPSTTGPHAVVVVFHDISAQREKEQHIHHLAYHDALTGLPNRALFMDRLEQGLNLSRRVGDRMALIFIDLDRFKPINDTHGHQAGDRLLVQVASRLQACLRQSDTAARVGGDEFIALLHGVKEPEDAEAVAQKIRFRLQEPFDLGAGLVVQISASIGVALDLDGLLDAESLRAQADQAMYQSKDSGGDRVTLS